MSEDSVNRFFGSIVDDPVKLLPAGSIIHFQNIRPELPAQGTYRAESLDQFDGILLSILFQIEGRVVVEGSAVIVAPGIAVAARHVIGPRIPAIMMSDTRIAAIGIAKCGMMFWKIRKILEIDEGDFVILSLEYASPLPSDKRFPQASLTTRLPGLGEPVLFAGFQPSAADFSDVSTGVRYSGDVLFGAGEVTNVHPERRDKAMLSWPVIEINCPARGGMSGDPAFDKYGNLFGVVCSSLESEEDTGPSYVSLIYPILARRFEVTWMQEMLGSSTSLFEMDPRFCHIVGRDAITLGTDSEGRVQRAIYTIWS